MDNSELTVQALTDYARKNHKIGKEGQTLVVIDECQVKFNSRDFGKKDRMDWVVFFTQHRKYGFDPFILIAQYDRMIDRQITCLIESEHKHRKVEQLRFRWWCSYLAHVGEVLVYLLNIGMVGTN